MRARFNRRLKIFFALSITILVVSIVVGFFFGRGEDKGDYLPVGTQPTTRPAPRPAPTRIKISPVPSPTILPGITRAFTGEKKPNLPAQEVLALQQAFELRKRLPLATDFFQLSYDYAINKFIVLIDEPFGRNKARFDRWLVENGYESIPVDKFIFRDE